MSAPMKALRTYSIEIIFDTEKKRTLYLIPKDNASRVESLLEEYRLDDFIPAEKVFADLYSKYDKAGSAIHGLRL